ncbi:MAG TPA: glutamine--fructose-6-phosphate transaminase (isomerizing), partial [Vicinamibacteria bacterium]
GIIENHLELKSALQARGHRFSSETDTEIFAHLVSAALDGPARGDLRSAVREALGQVRGTYAVAVIAENAPRTIVAAKNASPLVVGHGEGESFLASDVPAILEHTRSVNYLEEGELAVLTPEGIAIEDASGRPVTRPPRRIEWSAVAAEKDGHKHFMHKEIFEQPRAVTDTIRGRVSLEEGDVVLDGMELDPAWVKDVDRMVVVACGTSWHAGLAGRLMIETLARVPVEVELASEFRNRDVLVNEKVMCLAITQSGETADTLAAVKVARARGARAFAVCNVVGSAIARECDGGTLFTRAGPEIGVASTKAFTTQLVALALLAFYAREARGLGSLEPGDPFLEGLAHLPVALQQALALEPKIEKLSRTLAHARDVLFLGRGSHYPVALEGALKLKEISYIHAEGYPAGEMKHGPIALIDGELPVVALAPRDALYEKVASNLREVKAREGRLVALVSPGDEDVATFADELLEVPSIHPALQPIVSVVPLQLLAYHVARRRGCDVDQPRNLAKSVTVE